MIGLAVAMALLVQTNGGVVSIVKDLTPEQCETMKKTLYAHSQEGAAESYADFQSKRRERCVAALPPAATERTKSLRCGDDQNMISWQNDPADPKLLECVQ